MIEVLQQFKDRVDEWDFKPMYQPGSYSGCKGKYKMYIEASKADQHPIFGAKNFIFIYDTEILEAVDKSYNNNLRAKHDEHVQSGINILVEALK